MALKHAILAALTEADATGYELSKSFDVSVANFWPATPQQIYRELDRLETDGLLTAELVEQSRRPNKRIFSITPAGQEELLEFIGTASRPTAIRDDLLVKVVALDESNVEEVSAAVTERKQQSEAKLAIYRQLQTTLLDGLTEADYLSTAGRVGNYLALLRGISFEEGNQAWCDTALKAMAGRRSGIPG